MPLPTPSHLQFLVMSVLLDSERAGHQVRQQMAESGVKKSGPAFYQMMARLEDTGWVKGWYDEKVIDGQMIRERRYKLTGKGARAHRQTCDFYAQRLQAEGGLGCA